MMFDQLLENAGVRPGAGTGSLRSPRFRERIAEVATDLEANRRLIYDCCDKWNQGVYARTEIAMVKLAAAQLASRVADEAMELHANDGYHVGGPAESAWRDARLHRIGGGADEVQRQVIARMMGL